MSNGKITKQELSTALNQNLDSINVIENDINALNTSLNSHNVDKFQHIAYATASGTNTYTVSIPGI